MPIINWNILEDFDNLNNNVEEFKLQRDLQHSTEKISQDKLLQQCLDLIEKLVKSSGLEIEKYYNSNSILNLLDEFVFDRLELIKTFSNNEEKKLIPNFCNEIQYAIKLKKLYIQLN